MFDELGLTNDETLNLCQWEGTRAAKERYEREAQTEVKTTTGLDLPAATRGSGPRAIWEDWSRSGSQPAPSTHDTILEEEEDTEDKDVPEPQQGTEETSENIVGLVRDAMQERLAGTSLVISEEWEEWLKDALERHSVDVDVILTAVQGLEPEVLGTVADHTGDLDYDSVVTPSLSPSLSPPAVPQSSQGRTYDELHTIVDELQNNNTRLAADNAAVALFLQRSQTEAAR